MPPAPERIPGAARVLVLSTVYPNAAQPLHGLFVRERVRALPAPFAPHVIAPAPWFPFAAELRPGWRPRVPRRERDGRIAVDHPRFFSPPAIGKALDGLLLFLAALPRAAAEHRRAPFRVVDAHFAYPEGFAAVLLGRTLGIPVCLTLRGTLPMLAARPTRRPLLRLALRGARRLVAVSPSLREAAGALGIPGDRIRVIRNGVDTERFRPLDRQACRRRVGLPAGVPTVLSVGHLSERKGFHLLVRALHELRERRPDLRLVVVGGAGAEGFVLARLERLAGELGVADRVTFAGPRGAEELPDWYGAADVFALASAEEGCPNVVLEALACGRPVVATPVGDVPGLVEDGVDGFVVERRDAPEIAAALDRALGRRWDPDRRARAVRPWSAVGREAGEELAAAARPPLAGCPAVEVSW